MEINLKELPYERLLRRFRFIKKNRYSDQEIQETISELKKKKPDNVEVIKTNSGYRVLEKNLIPKTVQNFNSKSFSYSTGSKKFQTNFLVKYSATIIPVTLAVMIRIWTSDLSYKDELLWGLPIFVVFSIIFMYLFKSSKEEEIKLTFFNDRIEEIRGEKRNTFDLYELRRIEVNEIEKDYVNMIILYFENNRKLRITDFEPNFNEIKQYLKKYLSERMDYKNYLTSGSKF